MAIAPKKQIRGTGRVAFLAHSETFQKMLADGYPLKAIYNEYADCLGFGYPWFTKYVNKYLRDEEKNEHQKYSKQSKVIHTEKISKESSSKTITRPKNNTPFKHDPNSGNTRTDLI